MPLNEIVHTMTRHDFEALFIYLLPLVLRDQLLVVLLEKLHLHFEFLKNF